MTATIENPLRLPGQYYDQESGLHYNFFRDYDPATGRYIESDPIGLRGGVNVYNYAGENPVSHIDPKGLFTVDKECCKNDPDLERSVETACQRVTALIGNPKIRECIKNRCKEAYITCDGL